MHSRQIFLHLLVVYLIAFSSLVVQILGLIGAHGGTAVALGSANGVTVNMNSQRLRDAVASSGNDSSGAAGTRSTSSSGSGGSSGGASSGGYSTGGSSTDTGRTAEPH